jgi:hypothetical protein
MFIGQKYLDDVGKPLAILSDQGTQYTSKMYVKKMGEWDIIMEKRGKILSEISDFENNPE